MSSMFRGSNWSSLQFSTSMFRGLPAPTSTGRYWSGRMWSCSEFSTSMFQGVGAPRAGNRYWAGSMWKSSMYATTMFAGEPTPAPKPIQTKSAGSSGGGSSPPSSGGGWPLPFPKKRRQLELALVAAIAEEDLF